MTKDKLKWTAQREQRLKQSGGEVLKLKSPKVGFNKPQETKK